MTGKWPSIELLERCSIVGASKDDWNGLVTDGMLLSAMFEPNVRFEMSSISTFKRPFASLPS